MIASCNTIISYSNDTYAQGQILRKRVAAVVWCRENEARIGTAYTVPPF